MERYVLDTAIKFGAGRYRQDWSLLDDCGGEVARFGRHAFVLTSPRAWAAVKDRLVPSLEAAGVAFERHEHQGWCTYEAARKLADAALGAGCDEIVGVGGGIVMDLAKAVGEYAGLGVVNIATSIATCAPFTTMSVMYTPEGGKKDCWRYEHEIDACLIDLDVIANCPTRYTAAGILDAMAKKIEIQNGKPVMRIDDNKIDLFTAYNFSVFTYDVLEQEGPKAIEDCRAGRKSKAIEDVTFVAVAATGVIANITKSFSQSALAHLVYDGTRTHFTREGAKALHGELVAVGLFAQLYYNQLPQDTERLRSFMDGLGMPLTLDDCGVPTTDENLDVYENYLADSPYVEPDEASRKRLHEALRQMR